MTKLLYESKFKEDRDLIVIKYWEESIFKDLGVSNHSNHPHI